jgi:hypothetical protein
VKGLAEKRERGIGREQRRIRGWGDVEEESGEKS